MINESLKQLQEEIEDLQAKAELFDELTRNSVSIESLLAILNKYPGKVEKMEIKDKFEAVNNDYLKFERIKNKKATRPDVHAFILLEELFPSENNIDLIECAEHDIYYFSVEGEQLNKLTDEHILELVRCGISYDEEFDCLISHV